MAHWRRGVTDRPVGGEETIWWLVRHAPVAAPDGLIYGRRDIDADLSDAAAIAALAAALPPDPVWITTPLRRARDSLEAVLAARGAQADPVIEADFVEQDFGDWEGRPAAETWSAMAPESWSAPARIAPPGGETFDDVVARIAPAIDRLTARYAGRDIVAVAHAGTVRAVLAMALGGSAAALGFTIDPLSVSRFERIGAHWRIGFVNRTIPKDINPPP